MHVLNEVDVEEEQFETSAMVCLNIIKTLNVINLVREIENNLVQFEIKIYLIKCKINEIKERFRKTKTKRNCMKFG